MTDVAAIINSIKLNLRHGLIGAIKRFFQRCCGSRDAEHAPAWK